MKDRISFELPRMIPPRDAGGTWELATDWRVICGACGERGRLRVATRLPSATFPPKRVALLRRIASARLSPLGARPSRPLLTQRPVL